ncbi:MAG: hypothetical protein ABMA25_09470 [Ilumatobacteraceae bacterium]
MAIATVAPNRSTELLQQMIRLGCVNTGQADPGVEAGGAVDLLG